MSTAALTYLLVNSYANEKYTNGINYFSDNEISDNDGSRVGDDQNDNVRVFNQRRFYIAARGDEKGDCPANMGATAEKRKLSLRHTCITISNLFSQNQKSLTEAIRNGLAGPCAARKASTRGRGRGSA